MVNNRDKLVTLWIIQQMLDYLQPVGVRTSFLEIVWQINGGNKFFWE
jgi:hypothetical protein